ncbi:hypothetical protein MK805_12595 [Shimazuella sp. AN120528]|uniref:hypothetical protein n=1 Tax=Shimazuella soli TaxID=1892854 RepID=UPI001F0F385D|nr:hypothetical protein [Shimazuella soli]MCH5585782.1 hypothetical protein [Shimazuella soli]
MYYSYRRRSSGSSFLIFLVISAVVILFISPRARRKVGGWLGALSSLLMGVGKEVGRKVNQVGINITDKFRTYKLSDLAGGFMRTYTASKGSKVASDEEEEEDKIYFHDLTSRENQTDEDDEHHEDNHDGNDDTKKYPHE